MGFLACWWQAGGSTRAALVLPYLSCIRIVFYNTPGSAKRNADRGGAERSASRFRFLFWTAEVCGLRITLLSDHWLPNCPKKNQYHLNHPAVLLNLQELQERRGNLHVPPPPPRMLCSNNDAMRFRFLPQETVFHMYVVLSLRPKSALYLACRRIIGDECTFADERSICDSNYGILLD